MNLSELQKQIFEINKANGWHDPVPTKLEQHDLFHSEISEAFVELFNGRVETWYQEDGKPEGFCTELSDVAIRILDYFSLEDIEFDNDTPNIFEIPENEMDMILFAYGVISTATEQVRANKIGWGFGNERNTLFYLVLIIEEYLEYNNQSLTDLIEEKIEYNKTRGYRHGGKTI